MVVQIINVLIITVIIVFLLLVVVLLLSLLLYQDHYTEAAVESSYEKNLLFESEQSHWRIPAREEFTTIPERTIFQNTSQNRSTTIYYYRCYYHWSTTHRVIAYIYICIFIYIYKFIYIYLYNIWYVELFYCRSLNQEYKNTCIHYYLWIFGYFEFSIQT